MAEEFSENENKTEEPTQKRLKEALKRRDVVKSQEVNTWFVVAGGALVLMAFSGTMGKDLSATMRGLIANAHDISVDGSALPRLFQKIGSEMISSGDSVFGTDVGCARGNIIQHRLIWMYEVLTPKLSRISPAAGLKRIFSKQVPCQSWQRTHQIDPDRQCAGGADVAGAQTTRSTHAKRSVEHPIPVSILDPQAPGFRGCHARGRRRCRLPFPIPAVARTAEDVRPRVEGRIQTNGR